MRGFLGTVWLIRIRILQYMLPLDGADTRMYAEVSICNQFNCHQATLYSCFTFLCSSCPAKVFNRQNAEQFMSKEISTNKGINLHRPPPQLWMNSFNPLHFDHSEYIRAYMPPKFELTLHMGSFQRV